jgi:nitrate/TMAO reductase-like tetraheme cytochrome c subunit
MQPGPWLADAIPMVAQNGRVVWQAAAGMRLLSRSRRWHLTVPALAIVLLSTPGPVNADIAGRVIDDVDGTPIAEATVAMRARPDLGRATTDGDGRFLLPLSFSGILEIGAARAYDPEAAINYRSEAQQVLDGLVEVEIRLQRLPPGDDPNYVPPSADQFCRSCHGTYYSQWLGSRHAGAARNTWVLDLYAGTGTPGGGAGYVFRHSHDPDDTGLCATCHAPLEDVFAPGEVFLDQVGSAAGRDGVTCLACHQLAHVNDDVDALHHLGNGEYRFPLGNAATSMFVWGALPDLPSIPMQNSYSPLHAESKFCASCHQYTNPNTGAPGQNTYREWLASPYAAPGANHRTCQNCHMPAQATPAVIGGGGPVRPGSQRHAHTFIGATPARLRENILLRAQTVQDGGQLVVDTEVENRCGHNFPTGISIRNAVLVVTARIGGVDLIQVGGPVLPFWASDDLPGDQPGDYAGRPGKGYAKVLEGRINGSGPVQRPVLFIDAEDTHSDTGIASGSIDAGRFRFAIPPGLPAGTTAQVEVRLLYRRAWRALAVTKGWTTTPGGLPVEIEVDGVPLVQSLTPVADLLFADGFDAGAE